MYKVLLVVLGSTQILTASAELLFPLKSFYAWSRWVSFRFFPLHGAALVMIGFPLTIYKGYLSSVIFWIGMLIVLTGPFILVYPEKVRNVFNESNEAFSERERRIMIYMDAVFRGAAGVIFLVSCWKTFFNL